MECPQVAGLDEKKKSEEFCRNFQAFSKRSRIVASPRDACRDYAVFVVRALKRVCEYQRQLDLLAKNDLAALDKVLPNPSQRIGLAAAEKLVATKAAFGEYHWVHNFQLSKDHESAFRRYQKALHDFSSRSSHVMKQEVQSCGEAGEAFSVGLIGLFALSSHEAEKTFVKLQLILKDLIRDNILLSRAMRQKETEIHPSTINMGEVLSGSGHGHEHAEEGQHPSHGGGHDKSLLMKQAEGAALVYASQKAGHQVGHSLANGALSNVGRILGSRAKMVQPLVEGAGIAGGDAALHWIEHHEMDEAKLTFTGMRLLLGGAAALGVLPPAALTLWGGLVIEAAVVSLESWVDTYRKKIYFPQQERYLRYWSSLDPRENDGPYGQGGGLRLQRTEELRLSSQAASRDFHNRTWFQQKADPMNPGAQVNANQAYGSSNFQCP